MSRIGKNPVTIPQGVTVTLAGRALSVKGSLGELNWDIPHNIKGTVTDSEITFEPLKETQEVRALWGLSRAMTANMVEGVSKGFERKLQINGVGYRAAMQGAKLNLSVGYSHPVNLDVPAGLKVEVNDSTEVVITGADKQVVGQFAANVRGIRPPEPYKGKGIRYADEHVVMKEGKKK
jgi:large subunit ribosomal protein L6